jgi:hypothetical protein
MKKIITLQIIVNVNGFIVFILFSLGKVVDFKYNYDDPMVKTDVAQFSDFLYSTLGEFGVLFSSVVLFNIIVAIVIKKRTTRA